MSHSGLRVGLTGNIGSGKSTVAKIFELLHVPVYYADERAKKLMVEREDIRQRITEVFGEEVYSFGLQSSNAGEAERGHEAGKADDEQISEDDHRIARPEAESIGFAEDTATLKPQKKYHLNRAYLAEQVFENPEKLALLNGIVHPAVAADSLAWHKSQTTPYTLYEAAITFETGGHKALDAVILVTAPIATRLERVMARDGRSEAQVRARMERQWPEEKKIKMADHLIVNDGNELLVPQVLKLHNRLTKN